MVEILLETRIAAPRERVFHLTRSIDLHTLDGTRTACSSALSRT
jgi:hypothetical protein